MPRRPYFSFSVDRLRERFTASQDDPAVLKAMRAELGYRSTAKARALLADVEARISDLAKGKHPPRPARGGASRLRQPGLFDEATGEEPSAFADGGEEQDGILPEQGGDEGGDAPPSKSPGFPPCGGGLPPDDLRRPARFVKMAPTGVAPRPSKYVPTLSKDLVLDVPAGASRAKRFAVALDALVKEMKAGNVGNRRFLLEDGVATDLGTDAFGYVFDFVEDVEVFEDAKVDVILGSRHCSGTVVSMLPGKIVLALDANLGPRIWSCILQVDSTALLVALKERLEEVEAKTLTINTGLADDVLSTEDTEDESPDTEGPVEVEGTLDPAQRAAVRSALRRRVFFLWGPPGTGKTWTLAALVKALFARDERVLVCSNTNRAVNELLLQLCRQLGPGHPALGEGRVLRQGRVKAEDLGEFADLLLLDRIVARLTVDLEARRAELQPQVDEVTAARDRVGSVLRLFVAYDTAALETGRLEGALVSARTAVEAAQRIRAAAEASLRKASEAMTAWGRAGRLRRAFMPSEQGLKKAVEVATRKMSEAATSSEATTATAASARRALDAHREKVRKLASDLSRHDRDRLTVEQQRLDAQRAALLADLGRIQEQLADIERSVLANARIIGTTVTRSYLSARDIGAFDAVIVDEASMVLLPALYVAAGMARERVTISGDFKQLRPIVQSNQQAIVDEIGKDVFATAGVAEGWATGAPTDRAVKLEEQRRMVEPICALVRGATKYGDLRTHAEVPKRQHVPRPPAPFDGPLTVIDSSRLWPFESRNALGSRFNLMHALLVRNLCAHLNASGFLVDDGRLGVCTPYAAQAKLIHAILADKGLVKLVEAGTVHRYQGGEKRMMILDVPESIGSGWRIGRFIQADNDDDDGARLLNVAVSRAQDHLVILANLTYLDPRLPSLAKLRHYIYEIQRSGAAVDAQDVLALRPIEDDLRRYGDDAKIDWDVDQAGRFRSTGFDRVFRLDVQRAKRSVAVFSGYITEERAASYGELFRGKIAEGVAIRCVTRPPQFNGSMDPAATKGTLDALEAIGVVVDTRASIHQKVAVVDDEVVWVGSLNALSHTANTDELMFRFVGRQFALDLAPLLAIGPVRVAEGTSPWVAKENPACDDCRGRMYYARGRYGPFFKCEECGRGRSQYGGTQRSERGRHR